MGERESLGSVATKPNFGGYFCAHNRRDYGIYFREAKMTPLDLTQFKGHTAGVPSLEVLEELWRKVSNTPGSYHWDYRRKAIELQKAIRDCQTAAPDLLEYARELEAALRETQTRLEEWVGGIESDQDDKIFARNNALLAKTPEGGEEN
jgi:hypothetical protein